MMFIALILVGLAGTVVLLFLAIRSDERRVRMADEDDRFDFRMQCLHDSPQGK